MPDSLQITNATDQIIENDAAVSGAKLYFYDAGTTNDRTVYQDSALTTAHAQPVVADADGRVPDIWVPTGAYKVKIDRSDDTTLETRDNQSGAVDTSTFAETTAKSETPALSKTTSYTVTSSDLGKAIDADPTGGSFTITLISAVTAGDGQEITIKHVGTANVVGIGTVSSQTIDGRAGGYALTRGQQSITLRSNGADWKIKNEVIPAGVKHWIVEDRNLLDPPSSPTNGAIYLMPSTGTLTGNWASFSNNNLIINLNSNWVSLNLLEGDRVYIKDEDQDSFWTGSAWTDLPNTNNPNSSTLGHYFLRYEEADGTAGDTAATSAWTAVDINTEVKNTITGASLAAKVVTLPAGTYYINATLAMNATGASSALRLRQTSATAQTTLQGATKNFNAHNGTGTVQGVFTIADEETFELQYWATAAGTLGSANSETGVTEKYGELSIIDLSSLQGPQGSAGATGATGADGVDAGWEYIWDTVDTSETDPTSGKIKRNNATLGSITKLFISETDNDSNALADEIATWDDGTSTTKGKIKITGTTGGDFVVFDITSANTDNGSWVTLNGSVSASGGTFSDEEVTRVVFMPVGDKGETGAAGLAGFSYTYDAVDTSETDPTTGKLKFNNATLASITKIFISETDADSSDLATEIATWDDSTSANKSILAIRGATSGDLVLFQVDAANTDNGTWVTLNGTVLASSGTFSDEENVRVQPSLVGDLGGTGAAGTDAGIPYTFSTTTTMGDPGAGIIRFDNATVSSVANLAIDEQTAATGNPALTAFLQALDDSTSTVKGHLHIVEDGAPEKFAIFQVDSLTDNTGSGTGWVQVGVTHVSSAGTIDDTDPVLISFYRAGDLGATGSTGSAGADGTDPGIRYNFDTGTTLGTGLSDGEIQFNNGTFSSVTAIGLDDNSGETGNPDASAWILAWDDVANTGARGTLLISKRSAPENFVIFNVTGAATDNTTWVQVPVTYISGAGSFSAADALSVEFTPAGSDGAGNMTTATYDAAGVSEQLVGLTASQTLTNKTLTSPAVNTPTLVLTDANGAAPTTDGEIKFDRTAETLEVGDGAGTKIFSHDGNLSITESQISDLGSYITASSADTLTNKTFDANGTGNSISNVDMAADVTGTLPVANGGTGATTLTDGGILLGSGTGAITAMSVLADGSIVVGDGTTAPVSLAAFTSSTGNLLAAKGGTIGQQTIWVPAAAMEPRVTTAAATSNAIEVGTSLIALRTMDFATDADDHAGFAIQMPKGWDEGTLVCQFVWSNASGTGGVSWAIRAGAYADSDALTTALGTAVVVDDTMLTAGDVHVSPESSAMTVAGTPGAEEWVYFEVYRDVSDANDTLAVDARLHGVKIHYTIDAGTDD